MIRGLRETPPLIPTPEMHYSSNLAQTQEQTNTADSNTTVEKLFSSCKLLA